MQAPAHILVIDDEANIRASLREMLARDGYRVTAVESGEEALALIAAQKFDLALIDLRLKGIGGIEVLKALRQQSPDTVTIMLTAYASLETAVEALRQGAHDYLFKPCKLSELRESIQRGLLGRQEKRQADLLNQMARSLEDIRATISTSADPAPYDAIRPVEKPPRFLKHGGLVVDLLRHVVTVEGHLIELTPTEFDLLACLAAKAPQVVSPQELVQEVLGYQVGPWEASEVVRQHIYRIRQKVRDATGSADFIRTVRGIGYALDE
jgi:DNA-binding response OmpR family regulator